MSVKELSEEVLNRALETIGKNVLETGSVDPKDLSQEDAKLLYALGHQLYQHGDYERAHPLFQKLCIARPLESKNWYGLAATLQEKALFEEAIAAWTMASLTSDDDPHPFLHLAECHISLYNTQKALEALDQAENYSENDEMLIQKILALKQAIASQGDHHG